MYSFTLYFAIRLKLHVRGKGKGIPYSTTDRRVPELIPVLGSQPGGRES